MKNQDNMNNKLLLIDGSNLIFQMFYGMPSRIVNNAGIPIHGVIGFIGALRKIIEQTKPTHIVVIFDGECENKRENIDSSYKANREDFTLLPSEETPFFQLSYVYKCLDFMNIKYYEVESDEADDLIASYVFKFQNESEIVISSFDSDFFQLVSDRVKVLRYRGKNTVICDEKYILNKYGVYPYQYADYKSLVGDTSDNIKGVKGIGPKTAAGLISIYGDMQNLISHILDIEKVSVRNALNENLERLMTNYKLIKLNDNKDLPFGMKNLEIDYIDKISFSTNEILKFNGII
jgi:DNA polymerase-1